MSDLVEFHQKLWGVPPSEASRRLYTSGKLGFNSDDRNNLAQFGAVMTMALSMTAEGKTMIIVPSALVSVEALKHCKTLSRHLVKMRKGNKAGIEAFRSAILKLMVTDGIIRMDEPPRWVAWGFHSEMEYLPKWLQSRLLT